jgi:hypothetical protein
MVTAHQVTLSGLSADTTYYYQVNSTDTKSNHGKSGPHNFATVGFSLSGSISPKAGGSGATLTLGGTSRASTTADSSGAFSFPGLPAGSYTLTPSNTGYAFTPPSQNVTISTSNVTGVDFTATASTVAPTITTQPASQTVTVGQTATFAVVASGTTPLTYQWKTNGTAISGATSSSYTTPATTSSDNGSQFTVVVSNVAGSAASGAATLTVSAAAVAPSITTQPASQTITAGQTATFTVVAGGTSPLSYQWQKNGANISGATSSSYTTPATTTSDSGSQFTVAVSNVAGNVTSNAAMLTVNSSPQPLQVTTNSLPGGQLLTPYSANLQATGGVLPYNWSVIGGQLPNGLSLSPTNATITGTPTLAGGFTFTVQVKDSLGSTASGSLSISITAATLAISTTGLPAGTVSVPYSAQLNSTGGTAPYTWKLASGALPAGLTLSSSGAISGTPTTAGNGTFTIQVTDAGLLTAQQNLSISIVAGTACAPTGSGVCYYVDLAGSDSNSGTSSAPFLTIQQAANVVNPGDVVIVRDGIYNNAALSGTGSKLIVMSRGGTSSNHVVFVSEHKWGAKIDGSNNTTDTGWEFAANYIDVKDFECYGFANSCFENYNGGQYIDIAGNNIHDVGRYCATTTNGRVGIFISNPNVIIEGNQIHDIGRYAPGENGCTNPLYYQNNDHGIYVDGAFTSANNLTVKNNIFYRNERGWSIQVYPAVVDNLRILNNTFMCPNPYRPGHITLSGVTNSAIENNISWQPTTGFILYTGSGYANLNVANNLTYQGTVGSASAPSGVTSSGNLDNIDPLLVAAPGCTVDDPSVPNAYLQTGSPALDAGLTLLDVPVDYAGTARPKGVRFDIGAFEYIF